MRCDPLRESREYFRRSGERRSFKADPTSVDYRMSGDVIAKNYQITQLAEIEPTPCPCGEARRAFINDKNSVASMHIVDIKQDSELHFHKKCEYHQFYI